VALAVLYACLIVVRNRRLVRPPVLGPDGLPVLTRTLLLSDGEAVSFLDVGPRNPSRENSPTLLLVPGADGIKETFRYQVPFLADGFRVLCADLRRGFVREDTLDRLVEDVREVADDAGAGPLILIGQSLGGAIAMRFAVRYPERVRGLVVANSLARMSYEHVGVNRTLLVPVAMCTTRYLPTALGRACAWLWSRMEVWIFDASPGAQRVVQYALWTGPRTVPPRVSRSRVARLKRLDLRPQLQAIRAATLVVKGPRDHYVPPAWSHEIVDRVPGAVYREVPGTGHCSHISMPGSFNRLVADWLAGITDHGGAAVSTSSKEQSP
jgi:pimeloyl-ACP methyl ester carboxylesterase